MSNIPIPQRSIDSVFKGTTLDFKKHLIEKHNEGDPYCSFILERTLRDAGVKIQKDSHITIKIPHNSKAFNSAAFDKHLGKTFDVMQRDCTDGKNPKSVLPWALKASCDYQDAKGNNKKAEALLTRRFNEDHQKAVSQKSRLKGAALGLASVTMRVMAVPVGIGAAVCVVLAALGGDGTTPSNLDFVNGMLKADFGKTGRELRPKKIKDALPGNVSVQDRLENLAEHDKECLNRRAKNSRFSRGHRPTHLERLTSTVAEQPYVKPATIAIR